MNKFLISSLIFSFACGAENPEAIDDEGDIGQTEQAISIGNGGMGWSNTSSQGRCLQPGTSSQNCFVNDVLSKTVGYCFSGFSSADQAGLAAGIEGVDSECNWTFTPTSFPCTLSIQQGGVAQGATLCGGARCSEGFLKFNPTGTLTPLTSPPGVSHVNGTWTSFTAASVVVDLPQLNLFETSGFHTANLFRLGGQIANKFIGLGSQNSSATRGDVTDRCTFTNGVVCGGGAGVNDPQSAGENCRANNITHGTPGQISAVNVCAVN